MATEQEGNPKLKLWVSRMLLGFVLISIGFLLGKESARRSLSAASADKQADGSEAPAYGTGDKVIVYYLHATFRCVTCNTIERMAKEVVDKDFAKDVQAGRIEWRTANYQEEESMADRYGVVSACVVVVRIKDGKEATYERLDEVWTLIKDAPAFKRYIKQAIEKHLPKEET